MTDPIDSPSLEASLDDLKEVYRALARHREEHPELSNNVFYQSLVRLLEAQATVEGVNVRDEVEWHEWLDQVDGLPAPEPSRDLLN